MVVLINCSNSADPNIKLYLYDTNDGKVEIISEILINQQPLLIIDKSSIEKVQLVKTKNNRFDILIEFDKHISNKLHKITYNNPGKRLVFISNGKILFAPVIAENFKKDKGDKIKILFADMSERKTNAFIKQFKSSIRVIDKYNNYDGIEPELKKAYEFKDNGNYDEAIKIFKHLLKQSTKANTRVFLYNEIALCYRLNNDIASAEETYNALIQQQINIDLDNYEIISQAYFYLAKIAKRRQNLALNKDYLNKGILVLGQIINNYPNTRTSEWANVTIGIYELFRGNVTEAQKRAVLAKEGSFENQGYLLSGLYYEYQKEFKKAIDEYKRLIKNFPNSAESKVARQFIENLDNNKTNIEEFLNTLD
ncbi:MAG: tetratricopeptide repeat protein [Candidatus Hodarchaeales archaeon]|jgi:tetratricopeptide (TPR) repeat protein